MFFSGIISSILGFFIFNKLEESPIWAELQAKRGRVLKAPVRELLSRKYLPVLLVNLMMTIGGGGGYYLTSGYLPTFLKVVSKIPSDAASLILIASSFIAIIASIIAGHLSSLWGRKRTLLILALIRIVLLPLCYIEMQRTRDIGVLTFWALLLTFFGNAGYAPLVVFLNERFPNGAALDRHRPVVERRIRNRRDDANLRFTVFAGPGRSCEHAGDLCIWDFGALLGGRAHHS
jgi:MHS family proline/betaine transporter-like MFS transporter